MPVTVLDPKTALIVIDLQKGIMAYPTIHPIEDVLAKSVKLADAFRARNLPVVLVNVVGMAPGRNEQPPRTATFPPDWADLAPELGASANDHVVTKHTWGAFSKTGLADYLAQQGVTQVVMCGVATSIGVESTARQAHELGLNVTLAVDAMTDMNQDAHVNSVTRIFPRLGETGTADDIIACLDRESSGK
ncbi:isochorismatase family protein [Thalassospira mesophila]|uniref:Hydrolase n=1 Tax=Thalassospira mesophila TaxID=1293891 RepID=A0A1Y2KZY4_9PROT|nr:isochorismatase family protein [Thalassospira mesophila]OSQ38302.1 hydrolase [Thalassospira mesophila]